MSLSENVIEGTLKADGTLELDEKPSVPAQLKVGVADPGPSGGRGPVLRTPVARPAGSPGSGVPDPGHRLPPPTPKLGVPGH